MIQGMVPWAREDVIISGLGSPKEVLGERISEQLLDLRGYPKKPSMGSGELRQKEIKAIKYVLMTGLPQRVTGSCLRTFRTFCRIYFITVSSRLEEPGCLSINSYLSVIEFRSWGVTL